MYQLIAFDMDGTLLTSQHRISLASQEAIQRANQAGKEVILSTGRALSELVDYLSDLPTVRYGILASGALLYDFHEGQVLSKQALGRQETLSLATYARQEEMLVVAMIDGQGYVQASHVADLASYQMEKFHSLYVETAQKPDNIYDFLVAHAGEFEKINLYHRTSQGRDLAHEAFLPLGLAMIKAEETGLEFTVQGAHKGSGLVELCHFLKLPIEETIAVGDGNNDREILVQAGLGLAMGNAGQALKALADAVLPSNDQEGCALAIEQYLFS